MRAVLMQDGKLWVDEIPEPSPGEGEVLVKSIACGICGSDLHATRHTQEFIKTSRDTGGAFKLTTSNPVVLGHEFCAEIVEYGPQTDKSFKPGQLVCSVPVLSRARNYAAVGYSDEVPGGFSQYMVLSENLTIRVPAGVSATSAALTEPMAVGLHAVNKANLVGDEAIVVIGAGPVGLAVITALNARRATLGSNFGPIVAADFSPARRKYALQQGADIALHPDHSHPLDEPSVRQKPRKNLVVFECVGVPGILDDLFVHAPANTRIMVVGVCLQQDHFRPLAAINKELALQFVLGYSIQEFADSLRHISEGDFDVTDLVSHQVGLNEVADAFEALKDPESHAKVIVEPWQ